ncbi:MAG TPA: DUF433 domain-containing protein [Terracidiphilus sp.]|jgi:uncharacterized protein (DUF433 family)
MAALDWSQCPTVESIPGKVSGAWVLRGTCTPVKVLFENLEAGMSIEELIEQFPVTREQVDTLMAFVARSLDKTPTYA